jgi:hypothetical protein
MYVTETSYMNQIVMNTSVFHDHCSKLAGLETVGNTSCAPSAELNASCAQASARGVGAIVQTRFEIALGGVTARTFGAAKQEKLRGILVTLLHIDPTYIAFTVLRAAAGRRQLSTGIVVDTAITTPEGSTADVRSTIEDPAFLFSVGSLVVGEGLVQQISEIELGGIEAADGYWNADNLTLSLTADRPMNWSSWRKADIPEPEGVVETATENWGNIIMAVGSTIFGLILIFIVSLTKEPEAEKKYGKRIHVGERNSVTNIRERLVRHNSTVSGNDDGTLHINHDSRPRKEDGTLLKVIKRRSVWYTVVSTVKCVFLDALVEMDATIDEVKALPQLNPKNHHQYRWIQYMIWRRWVMTASLIIAMLIFVLNSGQMYFQYTRVQGILRRCDAALDTTIALRKHALTDVGFDLVRVEREDVLKELTKLPQGKSATAIRYKCDPTKAYLKGDAIDCTEPHTDSHWWSNPDTNSTDSAQNDTPTSDPIELQPTATVAECR